MDESKKNLNDLEKKREEKKEENEIDETRDFIDKIELELNEILSKYNLTLEDLDKMKYETIDSNSITMSNDDKKRLFELLTN